MCVYIYIYIYIYGCPVGVTSLYRELNHRALNKKVFIYIYIFHIESCCESQPMRLYLPCRTRSNH